MCFYHRRVKHKLEQLNNSKTDDESIDIKHELGFILGNKVATHLQITPAQRDTRDPQGNRMWYKDWEEKMAERKYIIQAKLFTGPIKYMINKEVMDWLEGPGKSQDKQVINNSGGVLLTKPFVGKDTTHDGVSLKGFPVLLGFLDGVKETMGWMAKRYVDFTVVTTPKEILRRTTQYRKAKKTNKPNDAGFHFDVNIERMNFEEIDSPEKPVSLYFPIGDEIKIVHRPPGGRRGVQNPKDKLLTVRDNGMMFFDSPTFFHRSATEHYSNSDSPPPRVNIMLHGIDSLKEDYKISPSKNQHSKKRKY